MTLIAGATLTSALLFVIFRQFPKFGIPILPAIVVNYGVAALCGVAFSGFTLPEFGVDKPLWLIPVYLLGFSFIGIFYLIGMTSQLAGVAVASVATKMSMLLPLIILGLAAESNVFTPAILAGIGLGLSGLLLTAWNGHGPKKTGVSWWLVAVVFVGSGLIDLGLAWFSSSDYGVGPEDRIVFASVPFAGAFTIGLIILAFRRIVHGIRFPVRALTGGAILGVVNYLSCYYLISAVHSSGYEPALTIPIVNMGIILVSGLVGRLAFSEQVKGPKLAGLLLCAAALMLLML